MLDALRKIVPLSIKRSISSVVHREDIRLPAGPRVFVFLAADYGNIGDLAITAAQQLFLLRSVPTYQVVPVPISATRQVLRSIRRQASSRDFVTIVGGGNMGSLYPDIEALRQLVIRSFPGNRIVCFPQTLDWDRGKASGQALARIVRSYSSHPDLHVFARESVTRAKLEELFVGHPNVSIGYSPDIVLSATAADLGARASSQPSGILLCMRDDRERSLDGSQRAHLEAALAGTGLHVETTDTHAGGSRLDGARCAQLLAEKLDQFGSSMLVVTDRLHGMILSVLAGAPCMVVPNANHKIRQTWFDWLSDQPQVNFLSPDEFGALPETINALLAAGRRNAGTAPIDPGRYDSLRQALRQS